MDVSIFVTSIPQTQTHTYPTHNHQQQHPVLMKYPSKFRLKITIEKKTPNSSPRTNITTPAESQTSAENLVIVRKPERALVVDNPKKLAPAFRIKEQSRYCCAAAAGGRAEGAVPTTI